MENQQIDTMKSQHHFSILSVFSLAGGVILVLVSVFCLAGIVSKDTVKKELQSQLGATSRSINKYYFGGSQSALRQLAILPNIRAICKGDLPPGDENVTGILQGVAYGMGAAIVYIMDANGTTVASTSYGNGKTLFGKNYSYNGWAN